MQRNQALDGLRAVAAILVVACHTLLPGFAGGIYGVDIFFVLSGYVITQLLHREWTSTGTVDFARFYAARALRLMPALIAFLAVYVVVAPLLWPNEEHLVSALLAGAYLTDLSWTFYEMPRRLRHTWSLAAEFHFYLIWPLCAVLLFRRSYRAQMTALALAYLAIVLWRSVNEIYAGPYPYPYHALDTRGSGLLVGCALALSLPRLAIRTDVAERLAVWSLVVLVSIVAFPPGGPITYGLAIPIAEACAAGLITGLVSGAPICSRRFGARPLVFLGTISYAIYLWHFPIALALDAAPSGYHWFVLTMGASILLATISWFAIEQPMTALRRRMHARPAPAE